MRMGICSISILVSLMNLTMITLALLNPGNQGNSQDQKCGTHFLSWSVFNLSSSLNDFCPIIACRHLFIATKYKKSYSKRYRSDLFGLVSIMVFKTHYHFDKELLRSQLVLCLLKKHLFTMIVHDKYKVVWIKCLLESKRQLNDNSDYK